MPPQTSPDQRRAPSASDRLQIAVLSVLAIAQAVVVGLSGSGITRIVAVLLALGGLQARLRGLWVLAGLIVVNLGFHLMAFGVAVPMRVGHVSLLVLYAAAAVASLAAFFATISFRTTFTVVLLPAVGVIAAEFAIPRLVPPAVLGFRTRWFDLGRGGAGAADAHDPYALLRQIYPDNPRGYFQPPADAKLPGAAAAPGVEYSLNALGCRGADYPIPNPHTRTRVLLLGGAGAFGMGVHLSDTVGVRLEQLLNQRAGDHRPAEVINCGLNGSSTAGQRAFYEQLASRYEPDVVVLMMGDRDNLSAAEERQRGFVHAPGRLEALSAIVRAVQWGRHEGRRPFEYGASADDVLAIADAVRPRGARFAVVIFRTGELDVRWGGLVGAVTAKLHGLDTPFQDLGPALLRSHPPRDLVVHAIDGSPNELAHREAAAELVRLLTGRTLVD